ncbi:MAG: response regulator [Bacteroidales bacterium]|nr:response regulator [Bacteroidales bacterium]MCF8386900.1 response regulator [Bacteroidales bacterium]MCF8396983.1 response regulator [Bacteroidales bacterium]
MMELRILIAEDLPEDAEMAQRELKKEGIDFIARVVDDEQDFKKEIINFKPHLVISDYAMPAFDGMEALKITKNVNENIPVIIFTGSMNEETAVACMKAGASDYVIKEQVRRLPFAVREAIKHSKTINEREKFEKQLIESEQKFRDIFYNHQAVKLIIDPRTLEIVEANQAAADFYGWSTKQLEKMKLSEINILDEQDIKKESERALKRGKEYFRFSHRLADGSVKSVDVFSSRVMIGGKEFLHSIIHDISDLDRAENLRRFLYEVSQLSASNLKLGDYLKAIHEKLQSIVKADNFYVALYNQKTDTYTFPYYADQYEDFTSDRPVSLKDTLTDYVRKTEQPQLITEEKERELNKKQVIKLVGKPSPVWIGAPLVDASKEEVTGVIALQDYMNKKAYTLHDLDTLQIIAGNIGTFIERIKNLEQLRFSESRFKSFLNSTSDLAQLEDEDYRMLFMNNAQLNLIGLKSAEEAIGKTVFELLPPDIAANCHESDKQARESGKIVKAEEIWGENTYETLKFPVDLGDGKTGVGAFIRDVTEKKKMMQDLVASKEKAEKNELELKNQKEVIELNTERLESLLRISQFQTDSIQELLDYALEEAIKLTSSKIGYIYFYNEATKQFILNTWSKEVMKECNVMNPQTVYDLDKTGCWGEAVRQRKPIVINDYQAENPLKKGTPNGHVKLIKFLTVPVIIDNKIVAVAGVANKQTNYNNSDIRQLTLLMDNVWKITERINLIKELNTALEKAEENDRLKSAFLANMSHEIRTPMNGILGFLDLIQDPELSREEMESYIDVVKKSGDRLLNTINDIIEVSKIESGEISVNAENVDIHERLKFYHDFFQPEAERNNLQFILNNQLQEKKFLVKTDQSKLDSILTNFIKNALKFTKKGHVAIGCKIEAGDLMFYVEDSGPGIPEEKKKSIFDRFVQADISHTRPYEGSGLGLSISKAYAEMLGGEIIIESETGKGSTFIFSLPFKTALDVKKKQEEKSESPQNPKSSDKAVLIVEDDVSSYELIRIILQKNKYRVYHAYHGREAIDMLKEKTDISLVLMDMKMPVMDGYEATRKIREFDKDLPVIALTAYALEGDKEKALQAGCNDYLSKPIKQSMLTRTIDRYL